jgi:hypothetical protein
MNVQPASPGIGLRSDFELVSFQLARLVDLDFWEMQKCEY